MMEANNYNNNLYFEEDLDNNENFEPSKNETHLGRFFLFANLFQYFLQCSFMFVIYLLKENKIIGKKVLGRLDFDDGGVYVVIGLDLLCLLLPVFVKVFRKHMFPGIHYILKMLLKPKSLKLYRHTVF